MPDGTHRCPFCDGIPGEQITTREMLFGLRHAFTYARCRDCSSLWLPEPPESMDIYYGGSYYSMSPDPKGARAIRGAALWVRMLLQLPPVIADRIAGVRGVPLYASWFAGISGISTSSRIADVGSGEGNLVYQMSRHGFRDVWGFDPFIAGDRDLAHAHLRRASLQEADGTFQVIMFNHSLEHFADPRRVLREAAQKLRDGGAIIVRTPVAGSFADRHYGPNWVGLDPPRHLAIPSQAGMRAVATQAGLTLRRVFFDSKPLQFWGSEHYRNDVPLHSSSADTDANLAARAADLNRTGEGDTAGFVLQAR